MRGRWCRDAENENCKANFHDYFTVEFAPTTEAGLASNAKVISADTPLMCNIWDILSASFCAMTGSAENLTVIEACIASTFTGDDVIIVNVSGSQQAPALFAMTAAALPSGLFDLVFEFFALHSFIAL